LEFRRVKSNYETIIRENLSGFSEWLADDRTPDRLGAQACDGAFRFRAFGMDCRIERQGVYLGEEIVWDPRGIVISLYARHAAGAPAELRPFKSFKDFPGSMPYQGAFHANSERVLVPHVNRIRERSDALKTAFEGTDGPSDHGGDFSMVLHPLPKVALFYVFYLADDEFPPSAACLFSSNALSFLPLDGAADLAEYTSKRMVEMAGRE
jgi:hypothetical protein